jgi:hypothetical protein
VSGELDRAERQRLRAAAETKFENDIKSKHPVQWIAESPFTETAKTERRAGK